MLDVARMAGVSAMTVSRALRHDAPISQESRDRVLKVVAELHYTPDQTAKMFATKRSGFIAALIPSINNSNFADTARGITDSLEGTGLQLLLGYTDYSLQRERDLVAAFLRKRPEGIILTGGEHSEETRKLLQREDIPIVETWDLPIKPLDQVVGFSNAEAASVMVQYLANKGYKNISFIGGSSLQDARGTDRRIGYARTIKELGFTPGRVITFGDPQHSMEQGARAMETILESKYEVDAVMCVSDLSAFGALMECRRRGISVPDQIAIAGFGDFEVSRYCYPSITTIGLDCYQIGKSAGELLLSTLNMRRRGEPISHETRLVDYRVISRETT
jgi:LacI family gluconate utilization system Gnt-I transcriptional repressor